MKYTNLSNGKLHLKIEDDYTDDDMYISNLLDVAELAVLNYLNDSITSYTVVPLPIVQATYFLMANWYGNRQIISFAQGIEIPYTFQFLLNPYKNYIVQ